MAIRSTPPFPAFWLALLLAGPALAQPASLPDDYRLPPGEGQAPPPVQGPVDPAHLPTPPVIAPPAPEAPLPSTQPSPAQPEAPSPAVQPPRQRADQSQRSAAMPEQAPVERAQTPVPPTSTVQPALEPVAPARPIPSRAVAAGEPSPAWWLAGGALAIFLLACLALALLARPRRERPTAFAPQAEPEPLQPVRDQPPLPAPAFATVALGVEFLPQRLMMTLVNARLSYQLEITNSGDEAIGPVEISADLIGAHAALTREEQFDCDGALPQHEAQQIAPSATAAFAGELVIPLAAIPPIRGTGDEHYFAALARLAIRVTDGSGRIHARKAVFLVGEAGEGPDARVRPVRLDLGPRTLSTLARREIETAARH